MNCTVYWINDDNRPPLGIMPRPRGGDWLEDEVCSLRQQGVSVLVSLLTPDEIADLHLKEESALCVAAGIQLLSFSIPGRSVPDSRRAFLQFATQLDYLHQERQSIVIHCRAGIGRRASIVAASLLARNGFTVDNAFNRIAAARGYQVPDTTEQSAWLVEVF
jgi:protein-tyrosine phosphatase